MNKPDLQKVVRISDGEVRDVIVEYPPQGSSYPPVFWIPRKDGQRPNKRYADGYLINDYGHDAYALYDPQREQLAAIQRERLKEIQQELNRAQDVLVDLYRK